MRRAATEPAVLLATFAAIADAFSRFDPAIQIGLASARVVTLSGMAKIIGTPLPKFEAPR